MIRRHQPPGSHALILLATLLAESIAPPGPLSVEEAVAAYRHLTDPEGRRPADCAAARAEIVVCGRADDRRFRLPLPEQRFGPGEVVRHPSEAPPGTDAFRGNPSEPSRLGDTATKIFGLLRSAVTDEDRGY